MTVFVFAGPTVVETNSLTERKLRRSAGNLHLDVIQSLVSGIMEIGALVSITVLKSPLHGVI